ncbi:interleukin-18 receptor accessory protein-like isoform X2 [Centroberyx gerrardi]|uniref:interleukin-18 receptor accessory protein-like isoform X2 n=1 Tax=Centroberyx gerrardi TaxID=166262 RepID=UPI003AABDF68
MLCGAQQGKDSGRELAFHLQVLEKTSLGCTKPEESSATLILGAGGKILCPGFNCSDQASNVDVIWYKGDRAVSELRKRPICEEKGHLRLCKVYETDHDVYFCDIRTREQGVVWTNRRAVNATVIPQDTRDSPMIIFPHGSETEEVELGQSHTLKCEVTFGFERNFSPLVQWYANNHGNEDDMNPLQMEDQKKKRRSLTEYVVTQTAVIQEVTLIDLNHTYTCIASNVVGNSSGTIKLKRKTGVKWPALVGYPIASLLLLVGLGIIVRVKWLELSLIYRSHCQQANNGEDEKEFDVFLSCVWSLSGQRAAGLALLSPSGPETHAEASPSSMDQLNTEEGDATQRPLEVLLPRVLEDQWGYRLCLLDRDLLPGGAYTEDVVHALQRSRMLICLLSADYLSNSNAVFVLESGIQALLQGSQLKLLLIWTRGTAASLGQLDPPLPPLVWRALKVLPSLDWASGRPARANSNFWSSLRKAMPVQSKAGCAHAESE